MANVSHASLTGSQLHEPKGADTATLGTVYVANGSGSGSWANVGTSSFTGMIADFTWPVVQAGWLELDGSTVSTTTYSALYSVMTIQQTGTRISASPIITSLTSTANMKAGYYVFGVGITAGTTILTVDSANQITMSGNAGSSGTATIIVSPWLLNSGTIKLPDLSTAGRYRRSRTSTTAVGQVQADQNQAHTHSVSGTTAVESVGHTHSGTTSLQDSNHTHNGGVSGSLGFYSSPGGATGVVQTVPVGLTGVENQNHAHTFTSGLASQSHTHTYSSTSGSNGGTEARPLSIVVMTCVKT